MARDEKCPICSSGTGLLLNLQFNRKLALPMNVDIRHCPADNFLFVACGNQRDYDQYYRLSANDSYHAELAGNGLRSPISQVQEKYLLRVLGDFFDSPKRVLDFGCGEACLLIELASHFPSSTFMGYDPSPGAQTGSKKARILKLDNLSVMQVRPQPGRSSYDLVIASHVLEHLLNFDLLESLSSLVKENGLLFLEVPDSLNYETHQREEFLYYFDRLHVNHFTPQALAALGSRYGLGHIVHFQYDFPYRDGGRYPALGMLFRRESRVSEVLSPNILDSVNRYILSEHRRARTTAAELEQFEGVLVWGAGDNFFRSICNSGPLSNLRNVVLLDRLLQEIVVGGRRFTTQNPEEGIRQYPWPVVITISEGRSALREQVSRIDPERLVFCI